MLSVFLPFCQGIRLLAIPELEYWQLLNFVLFEFLGIWFGEFLCLIDNVRNFLYLKYNNINEMRELIHSS